MSPAAWYLQAPRLRVGRDARVTVHRHLRSRRRRTSRLEHAETAERGSVPRSTVLRGRRLHRHGSGSITGVFGPRPLVLRAATGHLGQHPGVSGVAPDKEKSVGNRRVLNLILNASERNGGSLARGRFLGAREHQHHDDKTLGFFPSSRPPRATGGRGSRRTLETHCSALSASFMQRGSTVGVGMD